jgi:hypothetical protein
VVELPLVELCAEMLPLRRCSDAPFETLCEELFLHYLFKEESKATCRNTICGLSPFVHWTRPLLTKDLLLGPHSAVF